MRAQTGESSTTGLLSPVALFAGALLLTCAPVMRGGNRYAALIVLELLALVVLVLFAFKSATTPAVTAAIARRRPFLLLLASPLLLALVFLTPLPPELWSRLPGHAEIVRAMQDAGVDNATWRGASVSPSATAASLLAGLPLLACLLLGFLASIDQLRVLMRVVVCVAFAQVVLALLQVAGGETSPFYFGVLTFGAPVGTFANRNHFANYLAMALVALVWLAYESWRDSRQKEDSTFTGRQRTVVWVCCGLFLIVGILVSRSRGGALFGLPFAVLALMAISLRIKGWSRGWRIAVPLSLTVFVLSIALVGYELVLSRLTTEQLASSADFRGRLAETTFEGAMAFFPLGSGWGTFDLAYPRFQPASLPGFATQAHMDYVQMLFEGGIFFVVFAIAFIALAAKRAYLLARRAWLDRTLNRECMAAALAGLGLMALLLHSTVEFNMRIPANAMLGALLCGVFLRPLHTSTGSTTSA